MFNLIVDVSYAEGPRPFESLWLLGGVTIVLIRRTPIGLRAL
jgi:hypothetical protein